MASTGSAGEICGVKDAVLCFPHYDGNNADERRTGNDFAALSNWLSATIGERHEVVVMVDEIDHNRLNPLLPASWPSLLARLILAYPETRWAFSRVTGESAADFVRRFGIHTVLEDRADPLFDPDGLRDEIRRIAREDKDTQSDANHLPRRTARALALDEEVPYCYLHAYTAFRFGFRAAAIHHGEVADELLGSRGLYSPLLTLEDLYISFPDKKIKGMSDLEKRQTQWPRLKDAERRVFVTSDHNRSKWEANQPFLDDERVRRIDVRKLNKPHSGMFRIWEEAGLMRGLRWPDGRVHGGYVPSFVWPPEKRNSEEDEHGHSSPGLLMMLAAHMIERAERLMPAVQSVPDAVRGAVLANDALELLGTRTPTLAIEALCLKHQFEVLAECQFSGVEYHFPLIGRLAEIRRDVRAISQWFGRRHRESAAMNAEIAILSDLVQVFRNFGQFEEEQQCMNQARRLHNTLWMSQRPARKLLCPVLRYLELLLSSFAVFVTVLVLWVFGLSLLFWLTNTHIDADWGHGLSDAVSAFFSGGSPVEHAMKPQSAGWSYLFVACLAIVSGFLHLGVFISHLYSITSRK